MASNRGRVCEVCHEDFNEEERCPRSLPCSHCLCSECIGNLIAVNTKVCPFCRQEFRATSAKDFGINTCLLEVLKLLKEMEQNAGPSPGNPGASRAQLVTDLKEETEKATTQIINGFSKAAEVINILRHINNKIRNDLLETNQILRNEISNKIRDLFAKNEDILKNLDQQNERLDMQMITTSEKECRMKEGLKNLIEAETLVVTATAIEELDGVTFDAENWLQNHWALISGDLKACQALQKVSSRTKDRVAAMLDYLEPAKGKEANQFPDVQPHKIQEAQTLEMEMNAETSLEL